MIGNIMRELRNSKGLTIPKAAEVFGVAPRTYSSYESEEREPNITLLNKIADFYGVSVDCLLGREPVPDPFKEMKLSEEIEEKVIAKYMKLPENVRASVLDMIRQLGGVVEGREITETTEAGTLHDQLTDAEAEKTAG